MKKIGQLAANYQLKTDTLRYYEKQGLLSPSHRNEADYRYYSDVDEKRLRFILRCKQVGLSLDDIRELLHMDDARAQWTCQDVKQVVDAKAQNIQIQINRLLTFKQSLEQLSVQCCGADETALHCSILDQLESAND